ncbi:hypothetical protein J437_LFUL002102 [Ladona fulva]|uniref:Uncharacterized protein n=1 Tax=Ladona fulva TaxID=123851 RepID=A0A8K0K400_LADFU|nr:hypothetical protein J437_LFUL002102 [Ladona fulva]
MPPLDYLMVCRLCVLKNSSYANIFNITGTLEVRIADVINELLQLNVYPGDGLPDRICCDCLNELARFKRFKNISHEAKATLTSVIKGEITPMPKPSTSKAKDDIELVDLAENDDDSGAETIDAPSPKTELRFIELEESDGEHSKMMGYKKEDEKEVDGKMSTEKDPFESESDPGSDDGNILDDDMEADIVELEEEDTFVEDPFEDEHLTNHCSRTLGYDRNSKDSKRKAEMVNNAVESQNSVPNSDDLSEDDCNFQDESEKIYSCKRCSKVFPDNLELNIHIDKGDCEDFRCSNCEKTVSSSRELRKHVTYCEKSKLYACGICDKTFDNEISLKSHMKSHQRKLSQVQYECKKCKKAFKLRKNLKGHEKKCKFPDVKREYNGHYICGVCKDGFKNYSFFRKHFDTHMNIQKDALCGFCDVSYPSALDLRKHVWACHGTLECDICSKRFLESYFLNRHYVTHTLERPYSCSKCDKTYKTQYSLNVHVSSAH